MWVPEEDLTVDQLREAITRLEPLMDFLTGSFVELEYEEERLSKRLDRTFVSDIASVEALLLAALVGRLKRRLREIEKRMHAR